MCRFSRGRAFIFLIIWTHWDQISLICLQLAVSCFCLQSYCIFSSRLVPLSRVSACSPKQSSVFCPEEERGQNNNRASVWRNSLSNGLLCLWSPLKRLQRGSAGRTTNTQKCMTTANAGASHLLNWDWTLTHTFYTLHIPNVNVSSCWLNSKSSTHLGDRDQL